MVNWGPNGEAVFKRTYSRPLPNGEHESWEQTVDRVVRGNLALVHGDVQWDDTVWAEYDLLCDYMREFKIIPAGRHLWASGVKGRQYLMNCWVSGWGEKFSDHFAFTFLRLMEGGGVGSNYSAGFIEDYGIPRRSLNVHVVCDPSHPDYEAMVEAGVLSEEYTSDWDGAFLVEDSREGWADALTDLIDTYMTDEDVVHKNRVYDVTNVRAAGARLKTFGGTASGPLPFAVMLRKVGLVLNASNEYRHMDGLDAMTIDHAIAECVVSGGVRRSARMSIMRWDDPACLEFIQCKEDTDNHWTTNISVEVDQEFFDAWHNKDHPAHQLARSIHNAVVEGMLINGEPGYWNSTLSNVGEIEPVFATNPCGEITLGVGPNGAGEACNLGHVNMAAFATDAGIDYDGMVMAHRLMTRFLMRATFADFNDPNSKVIQDRNRRIGVGHLGVQDFLALNGLRYSDIANGVGPDADEFRKMLRRLYQTVRDEARAYAFSLRIPEPVKVTTVAPTGSISKLPGVGGEGIHPILYRYFEQRIRFNVNDPEQRQTIRDAVADGLDVETCVYDKTGNTKVIVYPSKNRLVEQVEARGFDGSIVEQADELDVETMLNFQAMYQGHYADNAVSFTINVEPGVKFSVVHDALIEALPSLKGTTLMVNGTRPQAPFTPMSEADYLAATVKAESDGIDMDCSTGACPIR